MERILKFLVSGALYAGICHAAGAVVPPQSQYIKRDTYNYMYPYMNNQMRKELNPGVSPELSTNPMDVVVKTTELNVPRRVVARSGANAARAAKPVQTASGARNAQQNINIPAPVVRNTTNNTGRARRVVARSGISATGVSTGNMRGTARAATRGNNNTAVNTQNTPRMASTDCIAGYTECMDMYCERENAAYNRCYCSSKLSQIDAQYQGKIDSLIKKILTLKNTNRWSDAEMNEYWMSTIGKYTGSNAWENIDNALNINWMDMESRVRGQNAFITGHEYCVQYLRSCYYMAGNLRDAYRSQIARDCATYEQSLSRIQNAAESIVESYQ